MESQDARFQLKNARITRIREFPKVCFLTLMCQSGKFPNYYDVTVFQPPANLQLEEGLAVTVNGELSMRKPRDGGNKWELQLVARSFAKGDDASAPRPKRSTDGPPRPRTGRTDEPVASDDNPMPDW